MCRDFPEHFPELFQRNAASIGAESKVQSGMIAVTVAGAASGSGCTWQGFDRLTYEPY